MVIDVGINVDADGNLCGDVNYKKVESLAATITSVPGGVGIGTMLTIGGLFMVVAIVATRFLPKLKPQTLTVNVENDKQQIEQPGIQSIV